MKHKKFLFKKFHRKYVFLQNSLFDFLYWRTSDFSTVNNSFFFPDGKNNHQKKFTLLEQDKICLQEYWKSSEHKQINNAIQHMNKEFNLSTKNSSQRMISFPSRESSDLGYKKKLFLFFQTSEKKAKKFLDTKYDFRLSLEGKQSSRAFDKGKFSASKYQQSNLMNFQKKRRKYRNSLPKSRGGWGGGSSNIDTFIPKSDCFGKMNQFQFFANQKIGTFFPNKKNFQQYWIFPLVGFVVFFSSQSSFFEFPSFSQESQMLKNQKKTLFFDKKQAIGYSKNSFFENGFVPESLFTLMNDQGQNVSPLKQVLDFSYSAQFPKEIYKKFQKLENNEFQQFSEFYLKFFQRSMTSFLVNQKQDEILKNCLFENSKSEFLKTIQLRKTIEQTRNVFHWKWFSLNSTFTFQQKNKFYNFFIFEIPLRAQFFFSKDQKNFFSNSEKIKKENEISYLGVLKTREKNNQNVHLTKLQGTSNFSLFFQTSEKNMQTPLLNFYKTGFLLNEFERNLNSTYPVLSSSKDQAFSQNEKNRDFNLFPQFANKKDLFYNNTIDCVDFETKNFLNSLEKDDFKFLNSLFSEINSKTDSQIQKTGILNSVQNSSLSSLFEQNKFQKIENKTQIHTDFKNLFFLQKWLQMQNFFFIERKSSNEIIFPYFSEREVFPFLNTKSGLQQYLINSLKSDWGFSFPFGEGEEEGKNADFSVLKNQHSGLQKPNKKIMNSENWMNLDFLYFKKFLKFFESKTLEKTKDLNNLTRFSNFYRFLQSRKSLSIPQNNQKNVEKTIIYKKKLNLTLKKRTFELFVFHHYNKTYKNFLKSYSQNKNRTSFCLKQNKAKNSFNFVFNMEQNRKILSAGKNIPFFPRTSLSIMKNFICSSKYTISKSDFSSKFVSTYLSSINSFVNKNFSEKKALLNFSHLNKIIQLDVPLFLDFSNLTNYENQRGTKNKVFMKKVDHFPQSFSKKYIDFKTPYSSTICPSSYENLESRPSNLSSTYFNFSNSNECHLSMNKSLSPKTFFSKIHLGKSIFGCSKNDFFETICENTLKNFNKNFFFKVSTLEFFKKSFFFEKIKKDQPFVFQNHTNLRKTSLQLFFQTSEKKEKEFTLFDNKDRNLFKISNEKNVNNFKQKSFFIKSPKSFVLKQKQNFVVFDDSKMNFITKFQNSKNNLYNFQSRKFEKVFRTLLSPLNKEKFNLFSSNVDFIDHVFKKGTKTKSLFFKTQKDSLLLQNLSMCLQNELKTENFQFYISSIAEKVSKKSPLFLENAKIKTFEMTNGTNEKVFKIESDFSLGTNKNLICPDAVFKRDGFVFVPKSRIFSVSSKSLKEKNNLTMKRFEKEKSLQKKRRMKKQKLETRRRKKRKRFFPRPLWLRFHLYKKFLKTRHPKKLFISLLPINQKNYQKNNEILSVKKNLSPSPMGKGKKTVSFVLPKVSKNQDFNFFSFSKTRKFHFSLNSSLFCQTSEKTTKRWKNVFLSSFFRNIENPLFLKDKSTNQRFLGFQKKNKWLKLKQKKIEHLYQQNLTINQKFQNEVNSFFFQTPEKKGKMPFKMNDFLLSSVKNQYTFEENKIYRKNKQKWGFYWKNQLQEKILYNKFQTNSNLKKNTNFFSGLQNSSVSQNREDYKISGEILSEFLRLSWKSYWFQTNFEPFTRRITQNFKKMQKIESEKTFSKYTIFDLFGNLKSTRLFFGFPLFQNNIHDDFENDIILRKSLFKKFVWYCNIRNSLESNTIVHNGLIGGSENSYNFQKIQNLPEYNRILYSRVSEILKNFKSSEMNDDYFMRPTEKNLKIPKRKNETILPNSSFFTKSALFYENLTVPSQPNIPAFSIFSSLFNNNSIKPTGELPTLRALWALHQTNFYHFIENNSVRNLWTLQKRTESLKSFKGTKKVVSFFRKYSGLEKLNAPKLLKPFIFEDSFEHKNQKEQIIQKKEPTHQIFPILKRENILLKNLLFFQTPEKKNKKILFVSTLKSGSTDFIEQLDNMSLQKFINVQQKCSIFGMNTLQQNSKISLRYLKFHLLSKTPFCFPSFSQQKLGSLASPSPKEKQMGMGTQQMNSFSPQEKQKFSDLFFEKRKFEKSVLDFIEIEKLQNNFLIRKPNQQNSAKSSLNFWWAQKNFQPFDFLISQNKVLNQFDNLPFSEMQQQEYFPIPIGEEEGQNSLMFPAINTSKAFVDFFGSKSHKKMETYFGIKTQFFWFGAIIFHLAVFFTLLKLPEIRSVFKFQCVLFYKFLNGFFGIVFSIYNLFKKYTRRGTQVAKKIIHVCSSSLHNGKAFPHFRSDVLNHPAAQSFFSRNRSIQEKNLFNRFLYSGFNSELSEAFYPKEERKDGSPKRFFFFASKDTQSLKISKGFVFEVFIRMSKFSHSFSFENISFSTSQKNRRISSFFGKQKMNVHNFYMYRNILNQENAKIAPKTIKGLFLSYLSKEKQGGPTSFFQVPEKNKKGVVFLNHSPAIFYFQYSKNSRHITQLNFRHSLKTMNTLSKTEKFICHLALSFLLFGKSTTLMSYNFVHFSSKISSKLLDFVEMVMFSIYKFLEKPAEFMIEWIALIFLIEWSSDIATFVPDTFDISLAKSSRKFLRPVRSGSLVLSFLSARNDILISSFYNNFGFSIPSTLLNSFGFFTSSNILSFVLQKRLFYFCEYFSSVLIQPDIDILIRQRKGMIFWDIWAEILLKAAEKYNVNIPSFVTLKEEQELFLEKLLRGQFLRNLQVEKMNISFFGAENNKNNTSSFNGEMLQQNSLASFVENFLVKERPQHFSEFGLNVQKKKIQQLSLCPFIFSSDVGFGFYKLDVFKKKSYGQIEKNSPFFQTSEKNTRNVFSFGKYSSRKSYAQSLFQNSFGSFGFDNFTNSDRWACHQYGTYQGAESDLFVDIHPPKSLKHIQFFKYYEPAQYTLGSLICQIYSGIFSKQVSKNILVIGAPGTAKTLFIQALAGETEMKIITDNAYRYSMVQRGVAVGMKYLRDVFDALSLQTPSFFLMEHIHVIGSKRPLLISDDENVQGIQSSFGLDQQEVHETNQMIYQLSRHSISDYKRPYKGDFSMGIPTNFFLQNLYSNSEKSSVSIFKNSQFSAGGVNLSDRNSPNSPLPIESIEHSLLNQGFAEKEKTDTAFQNTFLKENGKKGSFNFQSRLQIYREQIFAPPATSPFTILMMKEQKKLKPKKVVQENSWGGLSTDQMVSYQKENSSVRAKVAVLADITMNLSRGKLDMITDLLVIIDSVRSNRGFVVFATTHLPSLLDPALRRPGRFDETISLAQSPNFLNRFEILKMNFEHSLTTLDFLDLSILTENFSEMNLLSLITGTKLSFFHQYKYTVFEEFQSVYNLKNVQKEQKFKNKNLLSSNSLPLQKRIVSQIYPSKALHNFLKSSFFYDLYNQKQISSFGPQDFFEKKRKTTEKILSVGEKLPERKMINKKNRAKITLSKVQSSRYFLRNFQLFKYTLLPKGPSHELSLAYSKIGMFLAKANLFNEPTAFIPLSLDTNLSSSVGTKNQQFLGNAFYDSEKQQKLQRMVFLSGKISEFFIQKNKKISLALFSDKKKNTIYNYQNLSNTFDILENPFEIFTQKFSLFVPQQMKRKKQMFSNLQEQTKSKLPLQTASLFFQMPEKKTKESGFLPVDISTNQLNKIFPQEPQEKNQKLEIFKSKNTFANEISKFDVQYKTDFFWTTFGNNQSWRSATPFLFSIIQKRFLFTKNLLLSKMLFFDNKNTRKQPPNPPSSSILMPSKKYENFKRTENDFVQKVRFSINEKIQMHQQQRFLKQLYNIPVQQYFRSEMIENRRTFFSSSFQELAYLDSFTRRSSSTQFYQRKYLGIRHRFSNVNQWWNGFFPEHNAETTYLSDVDWRTMFGSSKQSQTESTQSVKNNYIKSKQNKKQSMLFDKAKNQTFEFTMDFPDAEQYYNPRNRRWYFHGKLTKDFKNYSSYWLTFDTTLQYEIYYHYLMQSFHQTFEYFDKNREMFDYFVFHLLRKGFLKELDYLTTLSRFQK